MRRTLLVFGLVAALLALLALPAAAAPYNQNTGEPLSFTCGGPIGDVTVTLAPGGGISAWNVATGTHYVAKSITRTSTIEVTAIDGEPADFEGTQSFAKDTGAKAPAKGRSLVQCASSENIEDGDLADLGAIDADTAAYFNSFFGTDEFAEGQALVGTYSEGQFVQVLVPGR
ncbi:MAG: hypothetical protein OEO77_15360 [Acidimicrobiia bacterium]|nr:hypothetical protein [Acidimicrobiia bacterium]